MGSLAHNSFSLVLWETRLVDWKVFPCHTLAIACCPWDLEPNIKTSWYCCYRMSRVIDVLQLNYMFVQQNSFRVFFSNGLLFMLKWWCHGFKPKINVLFPWYTWNLLMFLHPNFSKIYHFCDMSVSSYGQFLPNSEYTNKKQLTENKKTKTV